MLARLAIPAAVLMLEFFGPGISPGVCAGRVSNLSQSIRDLDFVQGVYFFLADPNDGPFDISDASIRVFLDDAIPGNDVGNIAAGRAVVDPLGPDSTASDSAKGAFSVRGVFALLSLGEDRDYVIRSDLYGPNYKVIQLRHPMNPFTPQCLAVSYSRRMVGVDGRAVGPVVAVGGKDTVDTDGKTRRVLELLWAQPSLMRSGTSDFFDTALTLTASRELELKNFYQLVDTPPASAPFRVTIRKGTGQPPVTTLTTPSGAVVPYLEALGLDNFDETSGAPVPGHDGEVDTAVVSATSRPFVDWANGTLFFYDLHPFAPRIGTGGKPFENQLASVLNRRATLADVPNGPNPNVYDKYSVLREFDTVYWMDVEIGAVESGLGALALAPPRPNPFDRVTALDYELPRAAHVQAWVFDVAGRVVCTLFDGPRPQGRGQLVWSGADDAGRATRAGIYLAAIEVDGAVLTRRIAKLE